MGETPQGSLDSPDDHGYVGVQAFETLSINDGGIFGAHVVPSVGRIGIFAPEPLVGRIFVDHAVHASGRDAEEQTGTAEFLEITQIVSPVGLGDNGYFQSLCFEHAADNGSSEGRVVNVCIATEKNDIQFFPASEFHFFFGGG